MHAQTHTSRQDDASPLGGATLSQTNAARFKLLKVHAGQRARTLRAGAPVMELRQFSGRESKQKEAGVQPLAHIPNSETFDSCRHRTQSEFGRCGASVCCRAARRASGAGAAALSLTLVNNATSNVLSPPLVTAATRIKTICNICQCVVFWNHTEADGGGGARCRPDQLTSVGTPASICCSESQKFPSAVNQTDESSSKTSHPERQQNWASLSNGAGTPTVGRPFSTSNASDCSHSLC